MAKAKITLLKADTSLHTCNSCENPVMIEHNSSDGTYYGADAKCPYCNNINYAIVDEFGQSYIEPTDEDEDDDYYEDDEDWDEDEF